MVLKGKAYWAKITGDPAPGYDGSTLEWSLDVGNLSESTVKTLKGLGVKSERIKNKGDDRGDFITLKRRALKRDGRENKPIRIVDRTKAPWDTDKLIGNGSKINVSYDMFDAGFGPSPVILAVQVVEHVPYAGPDDGFSTYDENGDEESWDE